MSELKELHKETTQQMRQMRMELQEANMKSEILESEEGRNIVFQGLAIDTDISRG